MVEFQGDTSPAKAAFPFPIWLSRIRRGACGVRPPLRHGHRRGRVDGHEEGLQKLAPTFLTVHRLIQVPDPSRLSAGVRDIMRPKMTRRACLGFGLITLTSLSAGCNNDESIPLVKFPEGLPPPPPQGKADKNAKSDSTSQGDPSQHTR